MLISNRFTLLLQEAGCNVEEAQRGIVYIDEVDKMTMKVWVFFTLYFWFWIGWYSIFSKLFFAVSLIAQMVVEMSLEKVFNSHC